MFERRTDLAMEARELWQEGAEKAAKLPGVRCQERRIEGYSVTEVEVLDDEGEKALGKPAGRYVTVDLTGFCDREAGFFPRAVRAVGGELRAMLPEEGSALAVGLGNAAMTPDSIGPLAMDSVLVTRHLIASLPGEFSGFRPVAVFRTGVLGTTGVESAEAVRALAERVRPAVVIAVDALAARRRERLCAAAQLSDTGILPGSGVGNCRLALNRETVGVPVIALGVPTVVDAGTLCADILEESGGKADAAWVRERNSALMVTPQDIDQRVRELAKVAGYAVNWALQDLEIEEMTALLS